jgi:ATP-dependent DNA helicase RecG
MLSEVSSTKSKERLQVLERYNNGFKIAEEDLKLRGSGEMYGTIQSGFPELKFASLFNLELIKKAQEEAKRYIQKDK